MKSLLMDISVRRCPHPVTPSPLVPAHAGIRIVTERTALQKLVPRLRGDERRETAVGRHSLFAKLRYFAVAVVSCAALLGLASAALADNPLIPFAVKPGDAVTFSVEHTK